jgi:hypothetical protein
VTGVGLPIPRELNLYETILNCSLEERLILFQIQTEAPGASRKKENLRSELCRLYPISLPCSNTTCAMTSLTHASAGRG